MLGRGGYHGLVGLLAVLGGCGGSSATAPEGGSDDTGAATPSATAADGSSGGVGDDASTDPDDGSGDDGDPAAPWDQGWRIPPSEQVPGDADAGYWSMLNEGYVSCGIPFSLFGVAQGSLGSYANGDPLPGRTGPNAEVPYNWTVHLNEDGVEITSLNCLECHAGEFNGELVLGLGKADADYTGAAGGALANIAIPPLPVPGIEELMEMAARYQSIGDDIRMYTVGSNPADEIGVILGAHRDPDTLEWHDELSYPIPDIVAPVDTPPWWRVAKKNGFFYNGMARGDHRGTMMFASSLCTDLVGEAEEILSYFNDINAYLRTIEPPTYPFAIDEALAVQGEGIFNRDCGACHGTYADDPAEETYPNLLLPMSVIGTDPLVAAQAMDQPFVDWYNSSWYGELAPLVPNDPFSGYVAPPLDGIWATAPFFHNGSVPDIWMVLDTTSRPTYWRRVDYDSTNFDEETLGWPYLDVPYSWDDAPEDEQKHVFDTTKLGHFNTGHDFGDHLTIDERVAVIEYLKTI